MTVKLLFFSYIDIIDPCSNNSCQNGAACVRSGLANYTCNCTSGFGGAMCAEVLPSTSRFEINSKFIYSFFLFIECSDANIQCPNAECIETNNPATPVYCQCYDGTRRDPRGNETCPLS